MRTASTSQMGKSEIKVYTVPPVVVVVVVLELPHRQLRHVTITKGPRIGAHRLAIIAPQKLASSNRRRRQSFSAKLRLPQKMLTEWVHCSDGATAGVGYPAPQSSAGFEQT